MKAEPETKGLEVGIKVDTAMALVQAIDGWDQMGVASWRNYIMAAAVKTKAYNTLVKDLNAVLEGKKIIDVTPDGVPAFMEAKGA